MKNLPLNSIGVLLLVSSISYATIGFNNTTPNKPLKSDLKVTNSKFIVKLKPKKPLTPKEQIKVPIDIPPLRFNYGNVGEDASAETDGNGNFMAHWHNGQDIVTREYKNGIRNNNSYKITEGTNSKLNISINGLSYLTWRENGTINTKVYDGNSWSQNYSFTTNNSQHLETSIYDDMFLLFTLGATGDMDFEKSKMVGNQPHFCTSYQGGSCQDGIGVYLRPNSNLPTGTVPYIGLLAERMGGVMNISSSAIANKRYIVTGEERRWSEVYSLNDRGLIVSSGGTWDGTTSSHAFPPTALSQNRVLEGNYKIDMAKNGNMVIAWIDSPRYPTANQSSMLMIYYDAQRGTWSDVNRYYSSGNQLDDDLSFDVSIDGQGDAYVVWEDINELKVAKYSHRQQQTGWSVSTLSPVNGDYSDVTIDFSNSGFGVATWAVDNQVFMSRYNGGWSPSPIYLGVGHHTDVAVDDRGDCLLLRESGGKVYDYMCQ